MRSKPAVRTATFVQSDGLRSPPGAHLNQQAYPVADEQDIALLCRETQSLRSRALVVAGETARCMSELRQSLAQRSDLLHWSEEVNASALPSRLARPSPLAVDGPPSVAGSPEGQAPSERRPLG